MREIMEVYFYGLGQVFRHGASGLRVTTGWLLLLFFLLEVLLNLLCASKLEIDSLALASGTLAQYFGPVVLLRADDYAHYMLVRGVAAYRAGRGARSGAIGGVVVCRLVGVVAGSDRRVSTGRLDRRGCRSDGAGPAKRFGLSDRPG